MSSSNTSLLSLAPSRLFRYFEAGSIVACIALQVWLAIELMRGVLVASPSVLAMLAVAFAAYVFADFLAGLVHFLGDSFGSVETPLLGLTFVLPFRAHHVHPQDICKHDFVATNGNNAFATLLPLVPTLMWLRSSTNAQGDAALIETSMVTLIGLFVLVLSVFLLLTNQIHKWAHVAQAPRWVEWLQRAGILLSPARHLAHHRPPYVGGYCVTSGICNRVLDPIGFFPFVERALRRVLALPRRKP